MGYRVSEVFPSTVAIGDDEGVRGVGGVEVILLGEGPGLCHDRLDGLLRQVERPGPGK